MQIEQLGCGFAIKMTISRNEDLSKMGKNVKNPWKKLGLVDKEAVVYLPGGQLIISWNGLGYNVFMTGPANKIFEGSLNLSDYLS